MTGTIKSGFKLTRTLPMTVKNPNPSNGGIRPALSILIGSCLLALIFTGWHPSRADADDKCVPVKTARVESHDLKLKVRGIGTLEAIQQIMIRPEVNGVIESVHFEEGRPVNKGDLLFAIDDAKIKDQLTAKQAGLAEARANLENAESVYNRRQRLFQRDLGTEEARDEARARYKALSSRVDRLKAEIAGVKETLADTRIKAPFGGVIGERYVDAGEWVNAGTQLAPLVQTGRLKIAFTVPEKYLEQVKTGQRINVHSPIVPEKEFTGTVTFVSPLIRENTRSLMIKAHIDNPEQRLAPGGFAVVDLILDVLEDRSVVPEEALIPTRTGYMVFVVQNRVARGRDIEIGLRSPGIVEIAKGVSLGETVIQSGHISVKEGDPVCEKDQK